MTSTYLSNSPFSGAGSPPIWKERSLPYAVPRDAGIVFIDQNASRLPASPLLPLIAAVSHYAPEFSLASVDFVTDRNGLRKLCRWASGDPKSGTFRIDVDLMGRKTILMQRCEAETTKPGGPGFENEFERASTTPGPGCEAATGHNRIVTYVRCCHAYRYIRNSHNSLGSRRSQDVGAVQMRCMPPEKDVYLQHAGKTNNCAG